MFINLYAQRREWQREVNNCGDDDENDERLCVFYVYKEAAASHRKDRLVSVFFSPFFT